MSKKQAKPVDTEAMPKVIFFTRGFEPSDQDREDAGLMAAHVVYRHACFAENGSVLEHCDAVAGAVPKSYASVYPLWSFTPPPEADTATAQDEE